MRKTTVHILSIVTSVLLYMAGASLIAISCTKTTAPGTEASPEDAITFSGVDTKAAVDTPDDISSFSVWGWYSDGTAGTDAVNVFNADKVSKSTDGSWGYDGLRYWLSGKTYDFYAVYPDAEALNVSCTQEGTLEVKGFDASFTGSSAVDLMTARSTDLDGSKPEPVALTFGHLLTRIRFAVKLSSDIPADYKVNVTSIGFTAYSRGDMTYAADAADPSWNPDANSFNSFDLTVTNGGLTGAAVIASGGENDPETVSPDDYDLLMIPQSMSQNSEVSITYTLENDVPAGDSGYWSMTDTANINLKSRPAWEPGESLTYTIMISNYNVSLQLSVGDWQDGNSGNEHITFE